jgi:hypothetical protein
MVVYNYQIKQDFIHIKAVAYNLYFEIPELKSDVFLSAHFGFTGKHTPCMSVFGLHW